MQRLLQNKLFVKAEKCEFHVEIVSFLGYVIENGQVKMDPQKIQAVAEWPIPTTGKQLQQFLGFANLYWRFIRDYRWVAAPLTCLTSTASPFSWTPEADAAFDGLKKRFTSAPVLVQSDPLQQFIMEVNASDTGVEVVLSQHLATDQKVHPCAFFSHRLSPAEQNYDIGNRELLAVKLALDEWRHWLQVRINLSLTGLTIRTWPISKLSSGMLAFVLACIMCARGKSSHQSITGLMRPLSVPSRPWIHIGMDFVTRLPPSQGNDTILIVDRFSKAVHFVPLSKLPSASETADLLVTHVVRLHGIPFNIISD